MASGLEDLQNKVEKMKQNMNTLTAIWKEQKPKCVTLQRTVNNTNEISNIMESLFAVFREAIQQMNEDKAYFLEKLKTMNEISEAVGEYISELTETTQNNTKSGEEEEAPASNTLVRVVRDVDRATKYVGVAINAAGKLKLPQKRNLQKTLKEIKKNTIKATKTIKKFKKEREKKEKKRIK